MLVILYLKNSIKPKLLFNGIYENLSSIWMNMFYIVSNSFGITIFDVSPYIMHTLAFITSILNIFMSGVVVILYTLYEPPPALSVTLYGPLALSTNLFGFISATFDVTCFMEIKISPYLNIIVDLD